MWVRFGDWELRLREGLRSKIATSNEYKKGTQAGDFQIKKCSEIVVSSLKNMRKAHEVKK
jgi:hypothetical protein